MEDRPLSIDIRHPLLLKNNELVLLTGEDGAIIQDIPGFGLFYRDTCYLSSYRLRLHGTAPLLLMSTDGEGVAAQIALCNKHLATANGEIIPDHTVSLRRTFLLLDDNPRFIDTIRIQNFGVNQTVLPLALELATTFESMFVLRGAPAGERGRMLAPEWDEKTLRFSYEGADRRLRTLLVDFSLRAIVAPRTTEQSIAHFELILDPHVSQSLVVTIRVDERDAGSRAPSSARPPRDVESVQKAQSEVTSALLDGYARLETPSKGFGEVVARSLSDLALLQVRRGEHRFTAAGVPWFVGLFGRDSLLPTIQCLAFNPDLGRDAARALAYWQGKKDDRVTLEEPGKILHELRVGELANLHEVTQTPSYASVDLTLLFLIAIARHAQWVGNLDLFDELRPNIDRALGWLDRKTAENKAGYVTYEGVGERGQPINQSWRDSETGVLRADGSYPVPPLALVEVQGYAYQARVLIAGLLRRAGEDVWADKLEKDAAELRTRFLRDFWMESEGCYCLALEQDGRQVASIASNAAQVLWTGISSAEHAARVSERIMRADIFSGWGIRTLSTDHVRYDPLAYQQGSVWPFDNSLIVSGLRRYGEDEAALALTGASLEAARAFRVSRLPRIYCRYAAPCRRQPDSYATRRPTPGLVRRRNSLHGIGATGLAR